ncbi:MAG: hypothetical protein B9S34_01090 [Opitutia bacterium Tous-C1TDCM]|nr:MAG: hypothetical protein B9S34_01090 [Opitutae bacterium Tous-C1TDCM]
MCFATVLALSLGSYMTLCYRTLELSSRTMQSTRGLELAETGMEEALWSLNKNSWTDWSLSGTTATRTIGGFTFDNGATGSVSLTVTNYNGSLPANRTVTVTGTVTQADGKVLNRTLTSESVKAPLFVNAVAATTGRVRFRSGGSVDSYDSSLGAYDAPGFPPGFSAVISSASSGSNVPIQLTNAQIKGYVSSYWESGPSFSTSARLIGPATSPTIKIDSSRISTSPYQPIFEEVLPTGSGTTLPSGTATIGTAGATVPTLYYASEIDLDNSRTLTVDGPVVIRVYGDVFISEGARIRVTANGSLRLHFGGDLGIGGFGIQNDTRVPRNVILISTFNPYESFSISTGAAFYGVIYTPNSSLSISSSLAFYGAIVARSVNMSASPAIHYDLALSKVHFDGLEVPYSVSSWRETTAQ